VAACSDDLETRRGKPERGGLPIPEEAPVTSATGRVAVIRLLTYWITIVLPYNEKKPLTRVCQK
jgi:hypothetical protein